MIVTPLKPPRGDGDTPKDSFCESLSVITGQFYLMSKGKDNQLDLQEGLIIESGKETACAESPTNRFYCVCLFSFLRIDERKPLNKLLMSNIPLFSQGFHHVRQWLKLNLT